MCTKAGDLPCKYVFHTTGPRYEEGDNIKEKSKILSSCLKEVLKLMIANDCKSICILAISTGIFGFPLKECVKVYTKTLKKFIEQNLGKMKGKNIIL